MTYSFGPRSVHLSGGEHSVILAAKYSAVPPSSDIVPTSEQLSASCRTSRWLPPVVLLAWLTTLALSLIALLRIFFHDGTHALVLVNSFTRYVYLPAYACLLFAAWKRRRWLALASITIIACHVFWLAPDFLRDRRFDSTTPATATDGHPVHAVRIFFANVRNLNREHDALLQEIAESHPDVVVLVESSGWWQDAFRRSSLMATYPYGSGIDSAFPGGVNIFSKLPITTDTQDWIVGRCIETVEIPLGSQTLHLIGLHAPRPMDRRDNNYDGYWRRVFPLIIGTRRPLVVVGDFNATQYSLVYERLKASGLRSAHEDRGRGYATSWPNGQFWLPPIRIDQALLSPEVACLGISEGVGTGSDHKPFILDVQIRD
jgi:endonuclease/exonuclease/phosphatase (EEP) superfamily protein YafD